MKMHIHSVSSSSSVTLHKLAELPRASFAIIVEERRTAGQHLGWVSPFAARGIGKDVAAPLPVWDPRVCQSFSPP
jgi:hypothetical protein